MSIFPLNDDKFTQVRALDLPIGHYAITASGPLGVREIRQIGDIDLIVDDALWNKLEQKYGQIIEEGIKKIRIGDDIEVLGEGSFLTHFEGTSSVLAQIDEAEILNGLPFIKLERLLYFKREMNRPKDQADIRAIEELLARGPKA